MPDFTSFFASGTIAGCTAYIGKAFIDHAYYGYGFLTFFFGAHLAVDIFRGHR